MRKLFESVLPFFLGAPGLLWQILFFYLPLVCIFIMSSGSFSYFYPFLNSLYARVILRSLLLAGATTGITLCMAYPTAYFLAFFAQRLKTFLLFLIILPFCTNFLLHVIAWFFVLEQHGLINTFLLNLHIINSPLQLLNNVFAVILMMVYYYLPFMVLPIYAVLEKFDYKVIEASLDLGATWYQTLARVVIPLTIPGIQAGMFLVFVPAFGEFAIPELMGGDTMMFVGTVVSYYILGSRTAHLGASFTLISVVVLIISMCTLYGITEWIRGKR